MCLMHLCSTKGHNATFVEIGCQDSDENGEILKSHLRDNRTAKSHSRRINYGESG